MRRKFVALSIVALSALAAVSPAGAESPVDLDSDDNGPYICLKSRPLWGEDRVCIRTWDA
ncbi:hypothetical protein DVS28_a4934 [Euzebya pacifica]|jgi:hypothetical protein|uniref:Uncharacterized protein n=1 Tax=Euzebya pacifica TaxID=1608957 RepID=A0A346Y544_9ACTN|nr:hypothetical protein [Euzebya pacifica]AXV09591.1 hypothetical protein DVS28_a4934 [Euzebya pacifica]